MSETLTPDAQMRALYEQAEGQVAQALEGMVNRDSFGVLLAQVSENVVGLSKVGHDLADLVLRNLRVAGRQDVIRLSRQLNRNEDKLERLLQEIEALSDRITLIEDPAADPRKPSFSLRRPGSAGEIRFAAIPLGHEFTSLVLALLQVGGHPVKFDADVIEQIGSDRMFLFASDYPHWQFDGDDPMPPHLPASIVSRMCADNPLETFPRLKLAA